MQTVYRIETDKSWGIWPFLELTDFDLDFPYVQKFWLLCINSYLIALEKFVLGDQKNLRENSTRKTTKFNYSNE